VRPLSILLCSASPRRRALLEALGHTVSVRAVDVDESERPGETASTYIERVVNDKLREAIALTLHEREGGTDARIVADTVVDLDGQILHKPVDRADAARILRLLSGRAHVVTTRFAVATTMDSHVESVGTRVIFRALEDDELEAYAATGEGDDKAGAYAIQGRGAAFVSRIEGSYGAVVGLPSCEVTVALRRLVR
jgi:septum formation protein